MLRRGVYGILQGGIIARAILRHYQVEHPVAMVLGSRSQRV